MTEHDSDDQAQHISARDARGGRIVLNTPARRAVFIGGLVALLVVALLVRFYGG
ncbi:peptide ABC transporter permease [Stakelama saccharophila]|uniref:Peptide ABC transporter permease n=1 Tax=Stakelama saccharophila TaxID=3075605 RepID=A0ABZ0BDS9_9SPHN|nr:peptide ABC transporter permease [Stakelama sp. W311]WNO54489.1 peptide ABC transporter permease [Stakelama sp. W311]